MKKEDGASNFFSNFNNRVEQSVENAENNTAASQNINPIGNLASVEANDKQRDVNQLTGEINQSIALNNAQNKITDVTNNVMDQAGQANPFKPNNNNDPNSPQSAPISNGTGSGRPNFDEGSTMSIKKLNEGAPMSNVLFKKK